MPRRKAVDGAPPAPKAPRSRKKKVNPEENKPPDAYDPTMMHSNGYMDGPPHGMEGSAGGYGPPYGEYGGPPFHPSYGAPPPFGSPEPANSPYIMPQQSNTPQPPMIMRPMPPPQQHAPTQLGPAPSALEFRIHEMNRRLYIFSSTGISESDHQQWWDAFSHEFFDDDCKLWFIMGDETTPVQERDKFCVGRNTVPRFFRSIFDSGMSDLLYVLRGPSRECQSPGGFPGYENDSVLQVTKFVNQSGLIEVNTECRLYCEFTPYDEVLNYRIRAWTLEMKQCDEFIYNDMTKEFIRCDTVDPEYRHHSRMGFFKQTLCLMSLARILEPMQMIMSSAKTNGNSWCNPRDLMKRTLFSHYTETQRKQQEMEMRRMSQSQMIMPQAEPEKPKPVRKRQRKPAANPKTKKGAASAAAAAAANASPAPSAQQYQPNPMAQSFSSMGYQDVMVVGDPSMMGGDFGDEDERTISRIENPQYDPNSIQMHQLGQGPPPPQMNGPPGGMGGPMGPSQMGPPGGQMGGGMPQSMGGMPPPMSNQMNAPMVPQMHQMPGGMNSSMLGGGPMSMPNGMPNGMPNQMPNPMQPPGYSFQPQQQWQQPPNSAMITG